jgi:hypothetical protein
MPAMWLAGMKLDQLMRWYMALIIDIRDNEGSISKYGRLEKVHGEDCKDVGGNRGLQRER